MSEINQQPQVVLVRIFSKTNLTQKENLLWEINCQEQLETVQELAQSYKNKKSPLSMEYSLQYVNYGRAGDGNGFFIYGFSSCEFKNSEQMQQSIFEQWKDNCSDFLKEIKNKFSSALIYAYTVSYDKNKGPYEWYCDKLKKIEKRLGEIIAASTIPKWKDVSNYPKQSSRYIDELLYQLDNSNPLYITGYELSDLRMLNFLQQGLSRKQPIHILVEASVLNIFQMDDKNKLIQVDNQFIFKENLSGKYESFLYLLIMKKKYPEYLKIYLSNEPSCTLHLKEIFQNEVLFSGTSNFTYSGLDCNDETNRFEKNEKLTNERITMFQTLITRSGTTEVDLNKFQKVPKQEYADNKFQFLSELIQDDSIQAQTPQNQTQQQDLLNKKSQGETHVGSSGQPCKDTTKKYPIGSKNPTMTREELNQKLKLFGGKKK